MKQNKAMIQRSITQRLIYDQGYRDGFGLYNREIYHLQVANNIAHTQWRVTLARIYQAALDNGGQTLDEWLKILQPELAKRAVIYENTLKDLKPYNSSALGVVDAMRNLTSDIYDKCSAVIDAESVRKKQQTRENLRDFLATIDPEFAAQYNIDVNLGGRNPGSMYESNKVLIERVLKIYDKKGSKKYNTLWKCGRIVALRISLSESQTPIEKEIIKDIEKYFGKKLSVEDGIEEYVTDWTHVEDTYEFGKFLSRLKNTYYGK